jgi:uncharacterized protein (TIRG00374 family)
MQLDDHSNTATQYVPKQSQPSRNLFRHPHQFFDDEVGEPKTGHHFWDIAALPTRKQECISSEDVADYEQLDELLAPDLDTSRMSTVRLMQISGMIQAVRVPTKEHAGQLRGEQVQVEDFRLHSPTIDYARYQTQPGVQELTPAPAELQKTALLQPAVAQPTRSSGLMSKPGVKIVAGLLVGVAMLFLISRFINFPTTIAVLRQNLTTPQGLLYAFLASASFLTAFSMRGTRWKMFLRPITNVSVFKAIQIYLIGIFVNVLLPIQGGEVAKSLLLKRVAGVPVSQSLPTVAMDKALDLMPALVIMALVPFLPGIHMSVTLWLILALVGSILLGVVFVVALAAWNRNAAIAFIQFMIRLLPRGIGAKIEGFALGFVDSLLAGARQPKNFLPAVLLTAIAICCDGLFAMFAFWTVGVHQMTFGTAIFGYTVFNMFTILPSPPGQVGSNELYGSLVFGGLLGFKKTDVLAMFVFSHPLTALIMFTSAMICLSALGLKIASAFKVQGPTEGSQQSAH